MGAEVARALDADLDVVVVRKLGLPGQEELGMGAIASGGVVVLNPSVADRLPRDVIDEVATREAHELARRDLAYRGSRPPLQVTGREVILVDDGLATGASMTAAIRAVKERQPARVTVAVPVAAPETCAKLGQEVDEVICLEAPDDFYAVGACYSDFDQTSDEEVRAALLDLGGPAGIPTEF